MAEGQEWFDRVRRKHSLGMLHAEAQDGAWLADPDLDVPRDWADIRELLARTYAFDDSPLARFGPHDVERLRPFALRAAATWDALPPGGSVEVAWPGANDLVVVSTEERSALALSTPRVAQVRYQTRERDRHGREQLVDVAIEVSRRPARRPPRRRSTASH